MRSTAAVSLTSYKHLCMSLSILKRKQAFVIPIALLFLNNPAAAQGPVVAPNAFHYKADKKIVVSKYAVACAHPLAAAVGSNIMAQGGNAFDAAIAVQLALAVVYPNAGNIGGGGFMVARRSNGDLLALDYRETAPTAARRDMYLDSAGNVIPNKSVNGAAAGGVPGTVAGLFEMKKYARLPFAKLIQPAIDLAQYGFAFTEAQAAALNAAQEDLRKSNTKSNVFEKAFWKKGDTVLQPDLARTLTRIRDKGAKGFYEGETADLIVAEMQRGGGLITAQDLRDYKAKWRMPLTFYYKGFRIASMPMPSSGGTLLLQMLKMVEDQPLPTYGYSSPSAVQLMTEAERRAYADRAEYMGDADFIKVPEKMLTSDAYIHARMADYKPGIAGSSSITKPGKLPAGQSEETTHMSIMDGEGNMVSITTTLNNLFGSKTVIGDAGFFLNDEMDDFSAKPGVPNLYGAVGGEANAIAPGKRMLSSMSPAIVLRNDKPFMVLGSPGGTTIPTSVFQTIVDIIDFGMSTEDAVNSPKFHHQWLPDVIDVEPHFPPNTRAALERMGYHIHERGPIGRMEVIRVLPDGHKEAVADIRGDDGADGW